MICAFQSEAYVNFTLAYLGCRRLSLPFGMSDRESEQESLLTPPLVDQRTAIQGRRIIFLAIAIFALIDIIMVGMGPMFVRMEELSICRPYYYKHDPTVIDSDGNIEESLCKVDEVQAELAFISGWLGFFETIPGKYFLSTT
jgi:hypothetical protein